jgi:hypothetical protein
MNAIRHTWIESAATRPARTFHSSVALSFILVAVIGFDASSSGVKMASLSCKTFIHHIINWLPHHGGAHKLWRTVCPFPKPYHAKVNDSTWD